MNRDEIDLSSISYLGIAKDLLKNWFMIVLFTVSVFLATIGFGQLTYVPEYTVSTTLVVTSKGTANTYASLSMASQMANVMSEVFQSDVMKQLVLKETGESIDGVITCNQIPETNLLVLNITSKNPQSAYQFMNTALSHYNEVSDYVFSNANLQVLQEPSIPTSPSNQPRFKRYRVVFAILGGLGMCGVVILFYLFRYTVKTSKGAFKQLDGNILGIIPYEKKRMKKKKYKEALLVSSPTVSMNYSESTHKLATRVEQHLKKENKNVLLVTSIAENEGKSTLAANIALSLAEKQKKVLLIDSDFRKPAQYKIFDKKSKKHISFDQVLNGSAQLQDAIVLNERTHLYELFLYRAIRNPAVLFKNDFVKKMMKILKSNFDYIIVDCSPTSASTEAEVWTEIVDSTLIVVRQDWSDVRVINDTVDMIYSNGCDFAGFALNVFLEEGVQKSQAYSYNNYSSRSVKGK